MNDCYRFRRVPANIYFGILFWVILMNASHSLAEPVILAFGDSLTAGFGVAPEEAYPARLERLLEEKGYHYKVVNAGVSGDTTAGGVARVDWVLQHEPKIVILELGANDGLRGLPLMEMQRNLETIIEACLKKGAKVLLVGMEVPPNMGEEYSDDFRDTFFLLARKYKINYLPFFLKDIAAHAKLLQEDGIHPVSKGYEIATQTVFKYLEPMLEKD